VFLPQFPEQAKTNKTRPDPVGEPPHRRTPGAAIIATGSQTGILGSELLPDYSATKGANNAFIKALAQRLIERGIRANVIPPGPVWTPLNPSDDGT